MFDFLSSSDKAESRQRRELFLDGSTPYSIARTISTSHTNRIKAKNGFKLTVPQKIYTDFNLELVYNKYDGNSESMSEDYLDSINTRLRSTNYNDWHSLHVDADGYISPRIGNRFFRFLGILYGFKHDKDENETARGFMTEQNTFIGL